jgi:hypothetical protein
MVGVNNFPALIQELQSELDRDGANVSGDRWQTRAHEVVKGKLKSPYEFLDWAKRDRHWSFTLAEVMREVCSKPSELAVRLLVAILEQLREEQQTAMPMPASRWTAD